MFAFDSVPAVFSVTLDPFIVYTSNVFAILGLRALFFVISGIMKLFCYLNYGLSAILAFVGFKLLIKDFYDVSVGATLCIIVTALVVSIFASIYKNRQEAK
jgi:tellurite resistance protein TerC